MKHKKVSQLLAASLSFLMIAMLCVSSVAMEPSMRIGSVTVHSSLFAKMASESPEKDLITQSNIVKATDEMIQFEEKTVLDVQHLDDGSSLTSYRKDVATILPSEFPTSISPCADGSINKILGTQATPYEHILQFIMILLKTPAIVRIIS